jgi:hypothetical protein
MVLALQYQRQASLHESLGRLLAQTGNPSEAQAE